MSWECAPSPSTLWKDRLALHRFKADEAYQVGRRKGPVGGAWRAKLLTLEAMKMQSRFMRPIAARISKLLVTARQHVEPKGFFLVTDHFP